MQGLYSRSRTHLNHEGKPPRSPTSVTAETTKSSIDTPIATTRRNWVLRDAVDGPSSSSSTQSMVGQQRAPNSTVQGRAYIVGIPYGGGVDEGLPDPPDAQQLAEIYEMDIPSSVASSAVPPDIRSLEEPSSSFGARARKVLDDSFRFIHGEEGGTVSSRPGRGHVSDVTDKWERRTSSNGLSTPSSPAHRQVNSLSFTDDHLGIHMVHSSESIASTVGGHSRGDLRSGKMNDAFECEVCHTIRRNSNGSAQCRLCSAYGQHDRWVKTVLNPSFDDEAISSASVTTVISRRRPSGTTDGAAADCEGPYVTINPRQEGDNQELGGRPRERSIDDATAASYGVSPHPPEDQPRSTPLVTVTRPQNGFAHGSEHAFVVSPDTIMPYNDRAHNRKFCLSVLFVVFLAVVIGVGIGLTIWFD